MMRLARETRTPLTLRVCLALWRAAPGHPVLLALLAVLLPGLASADDIAFFRRSPVRSRTCRTPFDPFSETDSAIRSNARSMPAPIGANPNDAAPRRAVVSSTSSSPTKRNTKQKKEERTNAPTRSWGDRYNGAEMDTLQQPEELRHVRPVEQDAPEFRWTDNPFDLGIDYNERPDYLPDRGYVPLIDPTPRPISPKEQAVRDLIEKELYRQMRRYVKKEWKKLYKEDPSMTRDFYRSRLSKINHIGKTEDDFDPFNTEYDYEDTRNEALNKTGLEGEKELMLVEWGPLRIDDEGSVSFNLKSFFRSSDAEEILAGPRLAVEEKPEFNDEPLISSKYYRVKTKLKVNFNPLRAVRHSDYQETITSYGALVEIDFLSDILKRKLFTTELEAEVKRDGRWGVFFNFVLKSRR